MKSITERIFHTFLVGLDNLNSVFPQLSIYDSKINENFLTEEIRNNEFLKLIKYVYQINKWECSKYYDNAVLSKENLIVRWGCFNMLLIALCNKYTPENPNNISYRKEVGFFVDLNDYHGPVLFKADDNCIFSKGLITAYTETYRVLLRANSDRDFYISFYLEIQNWLFVFIEDIFPKLGLETFFYTLTLCFPIFDEIIFKEFFVSFLEKNKFEIEISQEEDKSEIFTEMKTNLLHLFSYFFETTMNECFKEEDGVKHLKTKNNTLFISEEETALDELKININTDSGLEKEKIVCKRGRIKYLKV
ncbi:hypothetical protein CWI38_1382p0030 [Hamiltosporidium tvaerminnensis]|uniref:Uncharacterized protein n=1 Tax=Hamiltosporidium tvaerminnensis TaxID=1176355 RepID=A0A4Q9LSK6_9MICR|nr:hypothetical protein CWI38_1382p0030 [Hamiltosporidium tvaerminnensis]